jgi:spoIIIJ-associated protein
MSRRAWPGSGRIQVVCEGHRGKRDGELVEEIREIADQVRRTGQVKRLQPMNPYERRLVHLTIREFPGLETVSEGNGFMKSIKVYRSEGGK